MSGSKLKMIICINLVLFAGIVFGQKSGSVSGQVYDDVSGEGLISANIILTGTSWGTAADVEGNFVIQNIPPGEYTLRASYIGYVPKEQSITIEAGKTVQLQLALTPVTIEGNEIVVTAQAVGQNQAINTQRASDNIINVVSAAKIQELPDANAAESVGRLPGVSLLRSGGEGEQVVVRGLEPKFNAITINGVKLSSSASENRSADLSMISSNMLEGIEVSKTVSADMDANVIGGIVNFKLREARVKTMGTPEVSFQAQGAYNGLPNAQDKLRNYKFAASIENRMLENKLGVFVQGSIERRNLSSNELGATYAGYGDSNEDYTTQNITIDNFARDRKRGNAVLALDYTLPTGKIILSNLFSNSVTEGFDRQQVYNLAGSIAPNTANFISNYSKSTLNSITNMLRYEQKVSIFDMQVNMSHSYSETKDPKNWTVNLQTATSGTDLSQFSNKINLNPKDIVAGAALDSNETTLNQISTNYDFTRERVLSASVDFETPINFSEYISTKIKFGASYQYKTRSFDENIVNGETFTGGAVDVVNQLDQAFPWVSSEGNFIYMHSFRDRNYDYGKFMDNDYKMIYPLDFGRMQSMMDYVFENQIPNNAIYNYNVGASTTSDYWGKEDIRAAYIMATVKIGQQITLIPGVRFQQLKTMYTGVQGFMSPNSYNDYNPHRLVEYTAYHPYWLPDVSLRYKPLQWLDLRFAYTNTLSYPDYVSLAPRINVYAVGSYIDWNGFQLDPITSENYDFNVSVYDNSIGLFTAGAFLKKIKNLIYEYQFTPRTVEELAQYYPEWYDGAKSTRTGYKVITYINNPYTIDNYGMELDWQTHFWYLPDPFSGLVFNINYTHIFSKAEYPYELVRRVGLRTTYTDTTYYAPLLYQPDDIVNLTVGYDYKGFSLRISSIYSAKIFTGPNPRPQLRAYTSSYNRWDIAVKQKLPYWEGFEVFCNMNNINGADDVSAIEASTGVPTRRQKYDYMLEFGLKGTL